jgi:uncharacterized glyoxalase superfamily protein PhnB
MDAIGLAASLTVRDIQHSLAFYRDVMGFAVSQEHVREGTLRAVSFAAGAAKILISQDDGKKGVERAKGDGMSLMLTTHENIDALAAGIKSRGGTLDSEPADNFGGRRAFRLRDPDGFKFVIASEPA